MLDIPVKPHVKKYLLINDFTQEPYRLNESTPAGLMLINLIEPKRRAKLPLKYNRNNVISVEMGSDRRYNHKMWLPKKKAALFNSWVDDMIRREFYLFIDTILKFTEEYKIDRLIREFEMKYQLQDTKLSFQSLQRMFYRRRGAFKTRKKSS